MSGGGASHHDDRPHRASARFWSGFFTQRLMQQRQASAHTIASYRDTLPLAAGVHAQRLRKAPSALVLDDIDAPLVMDFLDELERVRDITGRHAQPAPDGRSLVLPLRGLRGSRRTPAQIQRVLAIPAKRFTRTLVSFLNRQEVDALLAAPDQHSWSGRRDHAWLLLAVQTGLRLSELTSLRREDLHVGVWRPCSSHRQRAQGKMHAAEQEHARRLGGMGARTASAPRTNRCSPTRAVADSVLTVCTTCSTKHVTTAALARPSIEEQTRQPARARGTRSHLS